MPGGMDPSGLNDFMGPVQVPNPIRVGGKMNVGFKQSEQSFSRLFRWNNWLKSGSSSSTSDLGFVRGGMVVHWKVNNDGSREITHSPAKPANVQIGDKFWGYTQSAGAGTLVSTDRSDLGDCDQCAEATYQFIVVIGYSVSIDASISGEVGGDSGKGSISVGSTVVSFSDLYTSIELELYLKACTDGTTESKFTVVDEEWKEWSEREWSHRGDGRNKILYEKEWVLEETTWP